MTTAQNQIDQGGFRQTRVPSPISPGSAPQNSPRLKLDNPFITSNKIRKWTDWGHIKSLIHLDAIVLFPAIAHEYGPKPTGEIAKYANIVYNADVMMSGAMATAYACSLASTGVRLYQVKSTFEHVKTSLQKDDFLEDFRLKSNTSNENIKVLEADGKIYGYLVHKASGTKDRKKCYSSLKKRLNTLKIKRNLCLKKDGSLDKDKYNRLFTKEESILFDELSVYDKACELQQINKRRISKNSTIAPIKAFTLLGCVLSACVFFSPLLALAGLLIRFVVWVGFLYRDTYHWRTAKFRTKAVRIQRYACDKTLEKVLNIKSNLPYPQNKDIFNSEELSEDVIEKVNLHINHHTYFLMGMKNHLEKLSSDSTNKFCEFYDIVDEEDVVSIDSIVRENDKETKQDLITAFIIKKATEYNYRQGTEYEGPNLEKADDRMALKADEIAEYIISLGESLPEYDENNTNIKSEYMKVEYLIRSAGLTYGITLQNIADMHYLPDNLPEDKIKKSEERAKIKSSIIDALLQLE